MRLTLDNGKVQAFENTYASKLAANIAVTNDKIVVLTSGLGTTANPTSVLTDLQTMGDGGGNVTLVVNTALGASVTKSTTATRRRSTVRS